MLGFVIVWIGQLISLLGTNMSAFALTIWAYKLTGFATALALVGFYLVTPMLVISPLAGVIVDRSNRELMMMVSDLASGLATIAILIMYTTRRLEIWHLYITGAIQGIFQTFQWPAYSAAITTMLPREQYGRANSLLSLAESGSNIFSPLLAGALLGNFFHSIPFAILAPLILASTGNNEISPATVTSAGAIGAVVGGVAVSAWGGPKRRVHGVLAGWIFNSLLGLVLMGVRRSLPVWVAASFTGAFFVPIINGSNQASWQAKVAPDVQGRVFSIRRLIAWFVTPLSLLIAGPLADQAFEPAMKTGGVLSATFAWLVGTNPGTPQREAALKRISRELREMGRQSSEALYLFVKMDERPMLCLVRIRRTQHNIVTPLILG